MITEPTYGKERESLLCVTAPARAFMAPPPVSGTYSQSGNQYISITTASPHLMGTNDTVFLNFTDTSGQPVPPSQGYGVTLMSPTTFRVTAPGLAVSTYGETNSIITVTNSGHGLSVGDPVYLDFTTGGASNGVYQVETVPSTSYFTVAAVDSVSRTGSCLFPKLTGGGFTVTSKTNLTVFTALAHGLQPGQSVYMTFNNSGSPSNGQYLVVSVPNATNFTAIVPSVGNQTSDSDTIYPLAMPAITRSGTVVASESTWNMGYTDEGSTSGLSQSPLRSPTVFNFFYPTYEFPGTLAAAGLTTPEFQLTSATSVAEQMNFMEGGFLDNTGNTNGLNSFANGNGSIVMDLDPWMSPAYASNSGIPSLVDALNSLLLAGQLSAGAKTSIINYVANTNNFPYTTPTDAQMRDRVRAVAHLIVTSPDFIIQK